MKCTNCGADIPDGSVFCFACGARVAAEAPVAPVQEPEPPVAEQEFVPPVAPVYEPQQPVYTAPVYEPQQPARRVPKALFILSKVFSIIGIIASAYLTVLVLTSTSAFNSNQVNDGFMTGMMFIIGAAFVSVFPILGLAFSIKAKRKAMMILSIIALAILFIGICISVVIMLRANGSVPSMI